MQPGTQDFLRHSSLILALFFNKVADEKRQHVFMAAQAGRRIESNMRAAKNARPLSSDGTFFLCHWDRISLEYLIQWSP